MPDLSLYDLSRKVSCLKKEKRYSEALAFFKSNRTSFSNTEISKNSYVVADIISCLRCTQKYDAGFKFLKIFQININNETQPRILNAYGWLLWAKYKAENSGESATTDDDHFLDEEDEINNLGNFNYKKNDLFTRIEALLKILLELNDDYSKTVISNLFLIVLKTEKNKATPNWKLIDDFCTQINPEKLSRDCSIIERERRGRMQDMELASDLENWYAYKTKALMKLHKWQECSEVSKEALNTLEKFHYSNDIWFARRIALSKKSLGNTENAIAELQDILKKKKEWFIQKELAELCFDKGDVDTAFRFAIDAICNHGPLKFKVDLLYLLGILLSKKEESDLAFKHFSLSKLIRLSEEWKVPQKVLNELIKFQFEEVQLNEIDKLKSDLQKYWKLNNKTESDTKRNSSKANEGEICKILHDNEKGIDGFLKADNREYYFSIPFHLTSKFKVKAGTKVKFHVVPSSQGKRDRAHIINVIVAV